MPVSTPAPPPNTSGEVIHDSAGDIAEEAASKVLATNNLTPNPGESALVAFAWELGEGLLYESGLRQFTKEVISISGPSGPAA